MANEIEIAYGTSGRTLYAVVRSATGTVWNTAGSSLEAFNAANWTDYDIALSEQGSSGYYVGNFPAAAAGVYNVEARDRAGGSPAVGDAVAGAGTIDWTGSAVSTLSSADDATLAAIAALNNLSAAQVNAEVDTALADVGLTTTITGRIDAAVTSRPTLAQILAGGDIDGYTLEETLKLCLAALAGKLSGAATTTVTIRSAADDANRIVATVDASGNRSVVTLNAAG